MTPRPDTVGAMSARELVPLAPALLAAGLYLTQLVAATRALAQRPRRTRTAPWPRVAVLRPLAGRDDSLDANLDALAAQEGGAYEVILGVATLDDPAMRAALAFQRRHPALPVRVLLTRPTNARNPKVAQLLDMALATDAEALVISDSNTRPHRTWLAELVAELQQPGVGLVSSLVVGTGERSFGAALENLQLCAGVAAGIAAVQHLGDRCLAVGKSMALWRRALDRAGGLQRVADTLAEDHLLGVHIRAAGYRVRTSLTPVANVNVRCAPTRTLERHTRWALMRRRLTPFGLGLAQEWLLNPLAPACVAAVVAPSRITLAAVAFCALLQVAGARILVRMLRGVEAPAWVALLEPLRVALAVLCGALALVSDRVSWRGHAFRVGEGTALTPLPGASREEPVTTRAPAVLARS